MVKIQKKLIDHLGISSLLSVAGGSMGGMQAMEWCIMYPEMVRSALIIATTSRLSAQGIAFNAVGRNAILSDPDWNNGDYYGKKAPARGLAIARMIGHITYLCEESMHSKFGRKLQEKTRPDFNFDIDFQVESYLHYQGTRFVERFDANSYLYITKAMDYFDIQGKYGSISKAFENSNAKFLIISFDSDWLFPTSDAKEIAGDLMNIDKDVSFCEIDAPYGHDSFLIEVERQKKLITSFLSDL
jgi:homoserine O-acetyltransferase